jgi:uncharacterized protein YndB with AHSA1/START domain
LQGKHGDGGGVPAAGAQTPWLQDGDIQQRLAVREVVLHSALGGQEVHGRIEAAIRIEAPPEAIWQVLVDYEHASSFVPGLKRCHRIDGAPDGTWALIEHEVKYSWLMPTIHTVFRAEYHRPWRIDFQRVSGDLKEENGVWLLKPTADGTGTIVEYEVFIDPGFWIPPPLVRASVRNELPAALKALRTRVEGLQMQGPREASR